LSVFNAVSQSTISTTSATARNPYSLVTAALSPREQKDQKDSITRARHDLLDQVQASVMVLTPQKAAIKVWIEYLDTVDLKNFSRGEHFFNQAVRDAREEIKHLEEVLVPALKKAYEGGTETEHEQLLHIATQEIQSTKKKLDSQVRKCAELRRNKNSV